MSLPASLGEMANQGLPRHVAIIMDGNGRWAQQRGKMRVFGHKAGVHAVRNAVSFASRLGLSALTLFAFSSENWRRPESEVNALMELFIHVLGGEAKKLHKSNIQLRIIGERSRFSERLQQKVAEAEALTANNTGLVLNVAANYGGRWDITQAALSMALALQRDELTAEQIGEETLGRYLSTQGLPDVDLMIRTGGDHRISNFLLWQAAYAELYFTPVLWPDFDDVVFSEAIASFASRERRFGCTGEQVRALLAHSG